MRSAHPRRQSSEPDSRARAPLRVLVADDVRDTVLTMVAVLEQEGHYVQGVYDGAEVLAAVRKFRPHAVILDIGMPGLTGYDVAKALRAEHGRACPVLIAVTAYSKTTDRLIGKAVGFEHYFGKPAPLETLLGVLSSIDTSERRGG